LVFHGVLVADGGSIAKRRDLQINCDGPAIKNAGTIARSGGRLANFA
jgi:hypothetical protein